MSVFGPYSATIVNVHDGDTINMTLDVVADLGFNIVTDVQLTYPCRVFGINAPELSTPAGKASRDYAKTLLGPGDQVSVLSHGWDKYAPRFDGAITLADGSDFAATMVAAGKAVPL